MYMSKNSQFGIGTELLQKITPLGPLHKAPVVGLNANGEEIVLDQPKGGAAHFVLAKDFVARTQTFIGERGPSTEAEKRAITARANRVVGTPYNLLTKNCEQLSSYVRTGKASSPQLGVGLILGVFFCVLLLGSN